MVAQLDKLYIRARPGRAISRLLSYALFEGRPLTTRGRWINPLLEMAGKISTRLPQLKEVTRPIFILGTGRSGTTILGTTLSLHPHLGYLNEGKLLWHIAYPFEDLNGNYTDEPARYVLNEKEATTSVVANMRRLYGAYLTVTGNQRVLEKYPELIFRIPFVLKIFPDARFIFLVRNGYDTARSIAAWSARHGTASNATTVDWWGKDGRKWELLVDQLVTSDPDLGAAATAIRELRNQTDRAAVEWLLTMRAGLQLLADRPDSTLRVDYEQLSNAPVAALQKILMFCELPTDPTLLDYASATIQPRKTGKALQLNETITEQFRATMQQLGY